MQADYIQHYGTDLIVVNAARVSMDKESDWDLDELLEASKHGNTWSFKLKEKDSKLIGYLAKHQHYTPFEHCGVTLRLKVPLFVRSQIHRHRTFAFNEISRRYVKDNLEFYWPEKWRKAADNVKQGSSDEEHEMVIYYGRDGKHGSTDLEALAKENVDNMIDLFHTMTENGVCTEQARMLLPQNLYTQFYMTGNLRNWAHFLKLRLDPHAQREVQEIAKMCEEIIAPLFPVSYEALSSNS